MENISPPSLPFLVLLIVVILVVAIKMIESIIQILSRLFQYFLLLCVFALIVYSALFGLNGPGHSQGPSVHNPSFQPHIPRDSLLQISADSFPPKPATDNPRAQPAGTIPFQQREN